MADSPSIFVVSLGLLGGLAVFLLGLDTLTTALKAQSGDGLKRLMGTLTRNRASSIATGLGVTVLVQSSSITTVLAVGFVSGGMLTFTQSLGIILGANIGTTVTAQIVAFKITTVGLAMLASGYLLERLARNARVTLTGSALLGLGLVFLGMWVMGEAVRPLRTYEPFLEAMTSLTNPLLGILAGAVFTAVVQSSSASTALAIALAGQGLIPIEAGVAIIIGANIGTCATAALAAIGKSAEAVRTAVAHVLVNVAGAAVWVFFIGVLVDWSVAVSPQFPDLVGLERQAAETPRQLAMAHTFFNVSTAMVLVWFLGPMGRFIERIVPERRPVVAVGAPRHLDDSLLIAPGPALEAVRREIGVLGADVEEMLNGSLDVVLATSERGVEEVVAREEAVDVRYRHIVRYLRDLTSDEMSGEATREAGALLDVADELESIADAVEMNLVLIGRERIRESLEVGPQARDLLEEVRSAVATHLSLAIAGAVDPLGGAAEQAAATEAAVTARLAEAAPRSRLLLARGPDAVAEYALVDDTLDQYRRIHDCATRIVRARLAAVAPTT